MQCIFAIYYICNIPFIEIQKNTVNLIIKIKVGNDNILTADITVQSVKELGLTVGKEVVAVIKSTSIMVGVE